MLKNFFLISFALFCTVSCSSIGSKDKNTDTFIKFLAREEYMKEKEPNRIFNPDSAMLISTLPEKIGNLISSGEINDLEIVNNGSGYSKRYKSKEFKKGYSVDVFAYHMRHTGISEDVDNEVVKLVYENTKKEILKMYPNSNIISDNLLIFTAPSGKTLKMREAIFEYWNPDKETKIRSYVYFGTSLDSYYRIRINCDTNLNSDKIYRDKEQFIKDFGYYYAEGMSLNDFNSFKKSGAKNPVKVQRVKS